MDPRSLQKQQEQASQGHLVLLGHALTRVSALCLAAEEALRQVAPELDVHRAPPGVAGPAPGVPEALDAQEAAHLCGVSVSKWRQMDADGHCPAPIELGTGRCPRWLRSELLEWMWRGAPPRVRWAAMRDASRRVG